MRSYGWESKNGLVRDISNVRLRNRLELSSYKIIAANKKGIDSEIFWQPSISTRRHDDKATHEMTGTRYYFLPKISTHSNQTTH